MPLSKQRHGKHGKGGGGTKVLNPMALLDAELLQDEESPIGEDSAHGISHLVGLDAGQVELTHRDEQLLREAFSVVDHDNDGELLHDELDAVLHILGARPTEADVQALKTHLDVDGDGDVEMDDWIESVRAGRLKIDAEGAALDLNKVTDIRSAFLHMDDNKSGMLTRDEFVSAMTLVLKNQHMDARTVDRIWDLWAAPMGDYVCELECWVGGFRNWSTEAAEMDPLRKTFIANFSEGVATQLGIHRDRVKVVRVLPGTKKQKDMMMFVADKANKNVSDNLDVVDVDVRTNEHGKRRRHVKVTRGKHKETKHLTGAEAESVSAYRRDICTVMFVVESLSIERLMAAISSGNVEHVQEEIAVGVPVNNKVLETGTTPLHAAVMHGHTEMCKLLLEGGADYTVQDRRGRTPLAAAQANAAAEAASGSKADAVLEILTQFQRGLGSGGASASHPTDQSSDEIFREIKRFRKQVRRELAKTAKSPSGLMQAQIGECPLDEFHALKFVSVELEKVITWPNFIKGYAKIQHEPLGEKLNIHDISQLSSSCLHKLIGQKEHMRALHHPSVSKLERIGIKMLARHSEAECDEWYHNRDIMKDEAARANGNHLETLQDHKLPVDQKLDEFAENEEDWATSTRRMILHGVIVCAFTGGFAAFLSGLGDLLALELYQPDAAIECPEPTGSNAGMEDCVEQRIILEAFFKVLLPCLMICTAVELGGLYYMNMHNCMKIASSVGLVLWPLDEGRVKIARRLVQAAFEITPSKGKVYGIDPLKKAPDWMVLMQALVHKARMGVTKKIVKLLVKRMVTRAGAREASYLAAVSAFSMIPVGMIWNGVIAYQTTREARLRALGTMIVIKYVDELLPLNGIHGTAGQLSNDVCTTIVRAIGCVAVQKREVHVNSDTLLRRVHERLIHLDMDLERDDELFEDSDGYGWGDKGFKEDDMMDDESIFLEKLGDICHIDEAHGELIFEVMVLASVINGTVGKHELHLLTRARQVIELATDAWPDTLSDEDKELHTDVLDSLVEERCRRWAKVIHDGGSHFVRRHT